MELHLGFIIAVYTLLGPGRVLAWNSLEILKTSDVWIEVSANPSLAWVTVINGILPENAFMAGTDVDGKKQYVCRGHNGNWYYAGLILGKFTLDTEGKPGTAEISYGGRVYDMKEFQILTALPEMQPVWASAAVGGIPKFAIEGGMDEKSEMMYIGRVHVRDGRHIVGKVYPPHNCCYVVSNGIETPSTAYDVLTFVPNIRHANVPELDKSS